MASAGKVIAGGRGTALGPADVFHVAAQGYVAEVDAAALEKLQRRGDASKKGAKQGALQVPPMSDAAGVDAANGGALGNGSLSVPEGTLGRSLSREQARASVLVRLLEVLAGGAVAGEHGPDLAVFLAALLNRRTDLVLPAGPTDAAVLGAIQRAAAGQGLAGEWGDAGAAEAPAGASDLKERLNAEGAPAPPLSAPGASPGSTAATAGIGALGVHLSAATAAIADAVAALSAEALQADVAAALERQGEHKWALEVASDLRSLLQGSKSVNPRKGGAGPLKAVLAVPLAHGALREATKAAASAVRVELSPATEAVGTGDEKAGGKGSKAGGSEGSTPFVPSFFVPGALAALLRSLGLVASCSIKRSAKMAELASQLEEQLGSGEPAPSPLGGQDLRKLVQEGAALVDSTKEAAAEIGRQIALGDIGDDRDNEETPNSAAEALAPTGGVPGVQAGVEVCRAADALRRIVALESLLALHILSLRDAVQAARVAASARAAAAAGAKEGKAAKDGKGGGAGAVVLGRGTALLKAFLDSRLGAAAEGQSALEVVQSAFDPRSPALPALEQSLRSVIEGNEARRAPKIAKGTRDFLPDQMAIRERAFAIITSVFKRHGAVALDTPVFELRETLMGKYGEDSKLIYDLADQGGEILSLRYDLTVPFARYLAMHNVGNIKRYHIARVYRRDNPQMSRGRYREFYQCDFDIAGQYATMVPDSEVLKVLTELLDELDIGDYEIKLNHRRLLDGMLDICGVPSSKFRAICSAVDKLDKEPWETVRSEMVNEKGLPPAVADRIGTFVVKKGAPLELLAELRAEGSPFAGHQDSQAALEELALLFDFLGAMGALKRIVFDLSLARGLDYYTGVIYEAVFTGGSQVGSIAAGGRYDNLVGMFSGKQVPAVGVSLGIERVFTIMEEKERARSQFIRSTQTEVLVASIGPDLLRKRMELACALWSAGIKAEFVMAAAPNMQRQLEFANKAGIPWMVLFGSDELEKGVIKVKDLVNRTEEDVEMQKLVDVLKEKLQ